MTDHVRRISKELIEYHGEVLNIPHHIAVTRMETEDGRENEGFRLFPDTKKVWKHIGSFFQMQLFWESNT